ncbi:Conserved_hypothetical protein [Hexamita inflata]|uniref:Uncharacterized protein n=1 Tax=Hexamita inflata TaxID=28002 RepID=A0AA86UZL7_9EUKA|nr:Conserved hypothetical protein [Hexamita inflata]
MSLSQVNNQLQASSYIISQQQETILNLILQINCTNNYGYSFINGSCIKVACTILGQQSINGICQCTNINSIIENNKCACPINTNVVGSACVCTVEGQMLINGVCTCETQGAFVESGVCTCGINSLNISNICGCPYNSALVGNKCICNQITGQQIINDICQCPFGFSIVDNSCVQTSYTFNSVDQTFTCTQQLYYTTFDIKSVTNSITNPNNFSNGYVFQANEYIQNAFINIDDDVYKSMNPLFQNQTLYTNIKIVFGTQVMGNGSIISNNNQIFITQMSILSKFNSQITVTNGIMNILQQSSHNASIYNLIVNLTFSMSNGNISLIQNLTGNINITNYKISGTYLSYNCVSLISLYIDTSTIIMNNINIMPILFCVGNYSSYLLSQIQNSQVKLNNISIIYGNSSKYQDIVSLSSTSSYYFGGLITNQVGTIIYINQLISNCYQNITTKYIKQSGLLIGCASDNTNSITVLNICLQYIFSIQKQLDSFGIIGYNNGNLSLTRSQITIDGQIMQYQNFGIIGYQTQDAQYSETINIYITFTTSNTSTGGQAGSLFGVGPAQFSIIKNIQVNNTNIFSNYYIGGLIGLISFTTAELQNINVRQTNIVSSGMGAGGLFGYSFYSTITIVNITIESIRISCANSYGLILGHNQASTQFNIQNSKSIGDNYINNILQENCLSFTNVVGSVTQC